jgi:hypothetical protein
MDGPGPHSFEVIHRLQGVTVRLFALGFYRYFNNRCVELVDLFDA